MRSNRSVFILRVLVLVVGLAASLASYAGESATVTGMVLGVSPDYGNIETDLVPAALDTLGLKQGDMFGVAFGEKHFEVYLGETYSDVPAGDWIAFITTAGNLRIARNHDNAAAALGVKEGDSIVLKRQGQQ